MTTNQQLPVSTPHQIGLSMETKAPSFYILLCVCWTAGPPSFPYSFSTLLFLGIGFEHPGRGKSEAAGGPSYGW